ncbi:MAG: GAF domain-containing protein [Myxococcota bacterium]
MAKFLVYIPSPVAGMPNLQIKIDADNWMLALQLGRQKVGEKTELGSNIMCDFKEDGTVEVTDPATGRAFSIKEIDEGATVSPPAPSPAAQQATSTPIVQPPSAVQPKPQTVPAPEPTVRPAPSAIDKPVVPVQPVAPTMKMPEPKVETPKPAPAQPEIKKAEPITLEAQISPEPKAAPKPSMQYQPVEKPAKKIDANIEEVKEVKEERAVGRRDTKLSSNIDSIMASLFTEVFDVYNSANSREDAANFMLDLAMKKIGAEAGSVLYADLSETELSFIAVRGPKSEEIKKFKVPIGKGIVGFCVDLGVSLAISDVYKDKRWFDKISKAIGFPTKSILCAPIQYEGQTIGAIELINKRGDGTFSADDLNILNYIAHETGEAFIRIEGKRQQK